MDGTALLPLDFAPDQKTTPDLSPLIVDSFAGGGGASTGIEMALGRSPDVAINHDENAQAMHEANHPETKHLITSIWAVDPRDLVATGQSVGLAWFSPDCKHFSKARGGTPVNKNIRDLAWVVPKWAELVRPDVIMLENVEEFVTWAPTRHRHEGGRPTTWTTRTPEDWEAAPPEIKGQPVYDKHGNPVLEPDPLRKGKTFNAWVRKLRHLGYKVEWRELRACDYGAPTIRKRFFLVARCDGQPIVWPEPTHGAPDSDAVKSGHLKPWRTAAECIDWSITCPSIFDTADDIKTKHGLKAKRPLAHATMQRIARGMKRYVLDAARPFLVNLTHGARVEDMADPFRTITGANRGEKALVVPSLVSLAHGDSGGRREYPLTDPYGVVTAGGISHAVATPFLASLKGTSRRDSSAAAPHPTVLAGGYHSAIVAPTLVQTGYGERQGQAPRSLNLGAPLGTVVAGGTKHALITSTLMGCGGRAGQSRPRGLDEPNATITAKADTCIASAFLAQHHTARSGVNPGTDARAPLSTIASTGSHQMPVAAWFAKYYGTGDGACMDDPMHTLTVKDRMGHLQADLVAPPFTEAHAARAREVADFLRDHGYWDNREFVTLEIEGVTFVIVDIGMRMLTPRELFRAQGFPDDYVIEGVWREDETGDWNWTPFAKHVQVSGCGNSVPPRVVEALVRANCGHLSELKEAA